MKLLVLTLLFLSCTLCTSSTSYHQSDNSVKINNKNHLRETNLTSQILTLILDNYGLHFNNTNDLLRKEPIVDHIMRTVFNFVFKMIKYKGIVDLPAISKRKDSTHYFEAWNGMFFDLHNLIKGKEENMYNNKYHKIYSSVLNFRMPSATIMYKYEAKYGIFWIAGNIWARPEGVSVKLDHEIHYGDQYCSQTVRNAKLNFQDIDVGLTGTGIFNELVGKFARWVIMENKDDLLEFISYKFASIVEDKVNKLIDCDPLKFVFYL